MENGWRAIVTTGAIKDEMTEFGCPKPEAIKRLMNYYSATGVRKQDVEFIQQQIDCSVEEAIAQLQQQDGCVINSIMTIGM